MMNPEDWKNILGTDHHLNVKGFGERRQKRVSDALLEMTRDNVSAHSIETAAVLT